MKSEDVARVGYRSMMKGRTTVIPGLKNLLLAESVRVSPRKVVTAVARYVQERVH